MHHGPPRAREAHRLTVYVLRRLLYIHVPVALLSYVQRARARPWRVDGAGGTRGGGREATPTEPGDRPRPRPAKTLTTRPFVFTFSRIFDCLTKHASLSPCATHTYTCLHHISHQAITQHSTDNTADPAQTSRTDEPSKPRTYSHENATAKHTSIIV